MKRKRKKNERDFSLFSYSFPSPLLLKRKRRERKKARNINVFFHSYQKLNGEKKAAIKVFLFIFSFWKRRRNENKKESFAFLRLYFCEGRNGGENRSPKLLFFAFAWEGKWEGVLRGKQGRRGKEKGPCFAKNKVQIRLYLIAIFSASQKTNFCPKTETLGCP